MDLDAISECFLFGCHVLSVYILKMCKNIVFVVKLLVTLHLGHAMASLLCLLCAFHVDSK